jgi:hypothetical protein
LISSKIIDQSLAAKNFMSNYEEAGRYRHIQAQQLNGLFEDEYGRPPSTVKELFTWITSREGRAVIARYRDEDGMIVPQLQRSRAGGGLQE